MMRRRALLSVVALAVAVAACASDPPPRAMVLPRDDVGRVARPLPGAGIPPNEPPAPRTADPTHPPATGDRELDGLRLGFHGCRVMGLRIQPSMSGKALLLARLGAGGEVLDVQPVLVEGLPHTVVTCLVERVWSQRFDPRGGYGSVLEIPVDFTREPASPAPRPTRGDQVPTRAL